MEQRVLERTRDLMATNTELERTMASASNSSANCSKSANARNAGSARILHDMVCQELTATALFLKSSAKKMGPEKRRAKTLEDSAETVNRNVVLARQLAGGLQAVELTASGLKKPCAIWPHSQPEHGDQMPFQSRPWHPCAR